MELLHNESLMELLDSESFWVAVAFFISIIRFFPKNFVLTFLSFSV